MRWLLLVLVAFAAATSGASAHVKVFPELNETAAPACSYVKFVMRVPTEKPVPTVQLLLAIPPAVTVVAVQSKPGWNATFSTTKGRISSIDWSGGQILPHEFDEFAFLATTPKTPATISWDALQYYADGSVVKWNGPPEAETPHSQTTIAPHACRGK